MHIVYSPLALCREEQGLLQQPCSRVVPQGVVAKAGLGKTMTRSTRLMNKVSNWDELARCPVQKATHNPKNPEVTITMNEMEGSK